MRLWPFGKKEPANPWDGPWSLGQTEDDDELPFLSRLNTGARALRGKDPYKFVVEITVPFREPTELRMPSPEENRELSTLEETLLAAIQVEGQTLLTVVLTGDGERQFILYTSDPAGVKAAFDAVQPRLSHGARLEVRRDTNWDVYRELEF